MCPQRKRARMEITLDKPGNLPLSLGEPGKQGMTKLMTTDDSYRQILGWRERVDQDQVYTLDQQDRQDNKQEVSVQVMLGKWKFSNLDKSPNFERYFDGTPNNTDSLELDQSAVLAAIMNLDLDGNGKCNTDLGDFEPKKNKK